MKRIHRLTDDRQFQTVRAKGKSWAHPLLVLVAAPNGLPVTRCGFSTGKRLGKAHVRNRIKRMVREAVRVRHPGVKKGYDLVWIARQGFTDQTDFWMVDATVENLLRRAKLIEFVPPQVGQRPRKAEASPGEPDAETVAPKGVSK
jgi:ribonuclease P protein component